MCRKVAASAPGERGVDPTHATTKSDCRSSWRLARQGTCPRFASSSRGRGDRRSCFSIRHSSRLWLPARLDSHGLSRRSVSRAGHTPGGPGQARARYSYRRTYCGLNRKRQSLGQWSQSLRREIRHRPAPVCPWSESRCPLLRLHRWLRRSQLPYRRQRSLR